MKGTKHLQSFLHRDPSGTIKNVIDADLSSIPNQPGAYVFFSDGEKFTYPNGKSRVIYIGKTTNLKRRIRKHKKIMCELDVIKVSERSEYWWYSRYQYFVKFGCNLCYFTTRGTQDPKDLENILIDNFYNRFFALPVGNGAISYRVEK